MFYIYCGPQKFFLKEQIKKTVDLFLDKKINDLNYVVINPLEVSINDIIHHYLEVSLFNDRKVIVIDNASFLLKENKTKNEDINLLNNFFKIKNDNVIVFFLIYEHQLILNEKIQKNIFDHAKIFSFSMLKPSDWLKYVQKTLYEKKISIHFDAIQELSESTLNDYDKLFNEVEKLFLCQKEILLKDVLDLVDKPIEKNVFDLLNSLLDGNVALSLKIYYDLIQSNESKSAIFKNNFSIFLLNIFVKQIRFFYLCDFFLKKGLNIIEIANKLKANKIRVKIVLTKVKKIKNMLNILDDIYKLDFKIKSNQIDKKIAMELFIINFSKNYLEY